MKPTSPFFEAIILRGNKYEEVWRGPTTHVQQAMRDWLTSLHIGDEIVIRREK